MSTLANRARAWNSEAMRSKAGAMARHGPHQVAKKSTTTGRPVISTNAWNRASSSAIGVPGRRGEEHLPHFGSSASRAAGTRFVAMQCAQTTFTDSCTFALMVGLLGYNLG